MVQDVHRSIIIFNRRGFSSVSIDGTGCASNDCFFFVLTSNGGEVTAAKGFNAGGMYDRLRASEEKPDLGIVTCDVNVVAAEWILISDFLKTMLLEIHSPEDILKVKED
ncbi:hypothetical protein DY000_02007624 [Brassica cretica]|uniref:Uncharacterized protein n=1 Tax=Brassica cretica TaxID=69181 RepID=A0ABQ7CBC6_BRACR|nr:hypothetical protein DY000_02007624 [Brassica cretica]